MTGEILFSNLESLQSDKNNLVQSLKSVIKNAFVEKFEDGYERPCEDNDFSVKKKDRESQIRIIKLIIQKLIANKFFNGNEEGTKNSQRNVDKELLALILILCGENTSVQQWNNNEIVKDCNEILDGVVKIFNCSKISDLISRNYKINLIKDIMHILAPNLSTATWKYFPASIACYKWILEMIKQPELSPYLPIVLPPALLLVDDFVNQNKIIGVQCLNHIVQNVTAVELQFCGHGDVIYNALVPLLRIREADLISPTLPCLVSLLVKLEMDFGHKDLTKWSRFDDVLEICLENMEMEHLIDLRNCYINNLGLLIGATGYRIIRWSKRLLRIFKEYIEVSIKHNDSNTTNICLKAVEKYIETSQLVTPIYGKNLIFTLLMVLNSDSEDSLEMENLAITTRCIKTILKSISQTDAEELKRDLEKNFGSDEHYSGFYKKACDTLCL